MEIHFFGKSDVGRVRSGNEDFFLSQKISDQEYLFIVADGMGGHQAGDVASRLASQSVAESYRMLRKKGIPIMESLEAAVKKANATVLKKAASDTSKRGMGTTFSAVVLADMKATIIHIGDSRIYLIRKNKLKKLTTDHTFVEKLVEDGRISAEEAKDHPQKNVLYMSLGVREGFMPEKVGDVDIENGDVLLMCTDGLSNMVSEDYFKEYALAYYPEEAVEALVRLANSQGGLDNITVQIIRVGSIEEMEETKPFKLVRHKRVWITFFSVLAVLVACAALWFWVLRQQPPPPSLAAPALSASNAALDNPAADLRVSARSLDDTRDARLRKAGYAADWPQYLVADRLVVDTSQQLLTLNVDTGEVQARKMAENSQLIPAALPDIFFLQRSDPSHFSYRWFRLGDKAPIKTIGPDRQYLIKDSQRILIPRPQGEATPLFLDESHFIFADSLRYWVIKNWRTGNVNSFSVPNLTFAAEATLSFQRVNGRFVMLYFRATEGAVKIFYDELTRWRSIPVAVAANPLALEWFEERVLIFYFPDGLRLVPLDFPARSQSYPDGVGPVRRVLLDYSSGRRLAVGRDGKFFFLAINHD